MDRAKYTTEIVNREPVIQTIEEYNNIAQAIEEDKDWFKFFISLCFHYYAQDICGGSLHIVLDDGNLKDTHLAWCSGYASALGDQEGEDIANLMRLMTMKQRKRVYAAYPYCEKRYYESFVEAIVRNKSNSSEQNEKTNSQHKSCL